MYPMYCRLMKESTSVFCVLTDATYCMLMMESFDVPCVL